MTSRRTFITTLQTTSLKSFYEDVTEHVVKAYGEVEIQSHTFLASALDDDER
jgi:hypothetical protein